MLLNTTGLVAAESLNLTDIQPSPVIERDNYRWIIPVQGGMQPYKFSTTGELPVGLHLDTEGGIIYGTPQQGMNKASYLVTIRVEDRLNAWAWRNYIFKVMYKSTIKTGGAQFPEEANIYINDINGNTADKLKSGETLTKYFSCGDSPCISVDDEIIDPTDNITRYTPISTRITVYSYSPDAEFIYNKQYRIHIVTDPPEAGEYFPHSYEWLEGPRWYKEGDLLQKNAPQEMQDGNGTKYSFTYWSLPKYDEIDTNKINWPSTRPGEVVAHYKIWFWLDTNIPLMDIEGGGWKEKQSWASWYIKSYTPRLSPDLGAFFNIYLIPNQNEGREYMDKPKKITISLTREFRPAIGSFIVAMAICVLGTYLYNRYLRNRAD